MNDVAARLNDVPLEEDVLLSVDGPGTAADLSPPRFATI